MYQRKIVPFLFLAISFLISGSFGEPAIIFPPGHIVHRQLLPPGSEVVSFVVQEYTAGLSLSLGGSCNYCFSLNLPTTERNSTAVLVTKNNSVQCTANLSPAINSPVQLTFCTAELKLTAEDGSTVLSNVAVQIYGNQAPKLELGKDLTTEFEENSLDSTVVVRLSSSDPDEAFQYQKRQINIASCPRDGSVCPWRLIRQTPYSVNVTFISEVSRSEEFTLVLNSTLDYETQKIHVVRISLTDAVEQPESVRNTVIQAITISVKDVQDTPPFFSEEPPATYFLDELSPKGTVLFSVKAIDGDFGVLNPSTIIFELCELTVYNNCSDTPVLELHTEPTSPGKGSVCVLRTFGIDEIPEIVLRITAIEKETNDTSSRTVRVSINDVDDHLPQYYSVESASQLETETKEFSATVDENSLVGTPVEMTNRTFLKVQDDDRGNNARFVMVIDPNDMFEVTPVAVQGNSFLSIRVKDNHALDAETLAMYINLTLTANGFVFPDNQTQALVQVKIIDVNDQPSVITVCPSGVFNATVNETIFDGIRKTVVDLGYNVTDADRDEENRNNTQFRAMTINEPAFTVTTQGDFGVVAKLDFETKQFHEIEFVLDNIGRNGVIQKSTCTVGVTIIDVNDESPIILNLPSSSAFEFQVEENSVGNFVSILARDPDATAQLGFTLLLVRAIAPDNSDANIDLDDHLNIEVTAVPSIEHKILWTAKLIIKKAFDREATSAIEATLIVTDFNTDSSLPSKRTAQYPVRIKIVDVNDNPPTLTYANEPVGSVLNLEVTELDINNVAFNFLVSDVDSTPAPPELYPVLTAQDPNYQNHAVVAKTNTNRFRLTLVKPFDWALDKFVLFSLEVFDSDPMGTLPWEKFKTLVNLTINDRNNNYPQISFQLPNNQSVTPDMTIFITESDGSVTFEPSVEIYVLAEDDDSEEFGLFEYSLSFTEAGPLEDRLAINSSNGEIKLIKAIDRDTQEFDGKTFRLSVQVKDNANNPFDQRSNRSTIVIKIRDINDNVPIFRQENGYSVLLLPNENVVGYQLKMPTEFIATDLDEKPGCGTVVYSLVNGSDTVSIHSETGQLNLTKELIDDLEFLVSAFDGSMDGCLPGHISNSSVRIKIVNRNDLYSLDVAIEMDDATVKNQSITKINELLTTIARQNDYLYVFYSMYDTVVSPKAVRPQTILFAFLNGISGDPVRKEQIELILNNNFQALLDVGAVVPEDPNSDTTTMDAKMIALIVLAVILVIFTAGAVVCLVQLKKLRLRLRTLKAAEAVGEDRENMNLTNLGSSPFQGAGVQKLNPVFQQFNDDNIPPPEFDEDNDDQSVTTDQDNNDIRTESIRSDGSLENIEESVARTNRQNVQLSLKRLT